MNAGDNLQPWIDPELEARIVALVLGEASDFEREDLQRLLDENAELALFKMRIEAVHGMLREFSTSEAENKSDDWKLSPERRENLLTTLAGKSETRTTALVTEHEAVSGKPNPFPWFGLLKIAALFAILAVAAAVLLPAINDSREYARMDVSGGADPFAGLEAPASIPVADRSSSPKPPSATSSLAALGDTIDLAATATTTDSFGLISSQPAADGTQRDVASELAASAPEGLKGQDLGKFTGGVGGGGGDIKGYPSGETGALTDAQTNAQTDAGTSTMARVGALEETPVENLVDKNEVAVVDELQRLKGSVPAPAVSGPVVASSGSGTLREELGDRRELEEAAPAHNKTLNLLTPASGFSTGIPRLAEVDAIADAQAGTQALDRQSADAPASPSPLPELEKKMISTRELTGRGVQLSEDPVAIERAAGETIAPTAETRPVLAAAAPAAAAKPVAREKSRDLESKTLDGVDGDSETPKPATATPARLVILAPAPADLDETLASEEPFSTFSLHVSDVSFKLAQTALANGQWPEPAGVRIEEFVNAFDYGDPAPTESDKVACAFEQSIHPFLQQRNLLRVAMRTAAAGRNATTPLRLTILLDNSGSMERIDRRQTVQRAFALLADQLQPADQVTLISFARQPRLLADRVAGDRSAELLDLVAGLPSEGGTNLEAALQLAFEKALEARLESAQNRIILLTDGAANLGDAEPESLSGFIDAVRDSGIAFDAAGIGAAGLNDDILEALTRKGDGRYYLLDRPEDADDGFARQIAGALRPAAKNVKIQVEFNPQRVGRYKLLGFEKHRLDKEDFRNDAVDAAEMAAEEAGVAVYQFEPLPDGTGDVGSVSVRFQEMDSGAMVEKRWPLPYEPNAPRLDDAAPSQRIAAVAAIFAARLKGDPLGDSADFGQLASTLAGLPERHRHQERVAQLLQMIEQARQLAGE